MWIVEVVVVMVWMFQLSVVMERVSWPQGPSHVVWSRLKCIDVPVAVSIQMSVVVGSDGLGVA